MLTSTSPPAAAPPMPAWPSRTRRWATRSAPSGLDYATSLAQIPDGKAKTRGVAFGILAADNLIALRTNDGRNAPLLFTRPPAPGVWRPTPRGFLSMTVAWMGGVTPLLVRSAAQFGEPGPPPALTSVH
jgi:hypothetical protein